MSDALTASLHQIGGRMSKRAHVAVEAVAGGIPGRIVGPFESMREVEEWIARQPEEDFGGQPVQWQIQTLDAPETGV